MMWLAAATVGLIGPHRQANHLGPYTHLLKKKKIKNNEKDNNVSCTRTVYLSLVKGVYFNKN